MRYVLTENIIIPAGTEFVPNDEHGAGGLTFIDQHLLMRVSIGRKDALEKGSIVMRQDASHLSIVR